MEILVEGRAGNVACLILEFNKKGEPNWRTKFNIRLEELDEYSIVSFDDDNNPDGHEIW